MAKGQNFRQHTLCRTGGLRGKSKDRVRKGTLPFDKGPHLPEVSLLDCQSKVLCLPQILNPTDFPVHTKKPVILVIAAAFLAYASLIPVPKVLSEPLDHHWGIIILVAASLVSLGMILWMGRRKVAFHVTRWVLSVWLVLSIIAFYDRCLLACGLTKAPVDPMETLNAIMLGVAAVLMALLFMFHGFGKSSRCYYGVGNHDHGVALPSPH